MCLRRSVMKFAEEYKSKGFPIHGLINNAGIFLIEPEITPDGFEVQASHCLMAHSNASIIVPQSTLLAHCRLLWACSSHPSHIAWVPRTGSKVMVRCVDHDQDKPLWACAVDAAASGCCEEVSALQNGVGGLPSRGLCQSGLDRPQVRTPADHTAPLSEVSVQKCHWRPMSALHQGRRRTHDLK